MKVILALSSGSIRGILPVKVLAYLELTSGYPISTLCDVIGGTSIRGLTALALGAANGSVPLYSAVDILAMLTGDLSGAFVYNPGFSVGIMVGGVSFNGLTCPKWSSTSLESYLQGKLGTRLMRDLLMDVVLPTYDMVAMEPVYLKNLDAMFQDMYLYDAARAMSAAPTYLPPFKWSGSTRQYNFLDGGLSTNNNPSMTAYLYSKEIAPDEDVLLVSLGCGEIAGTGFTYNASNAWGIISWCKPVINVLLDASEYDRHLQVHSVLSDLDDGTKRYWRYQAENVSSSIGALDDISSENVANLVVLGDAFVLANKDSLDELVATIVSLKEIG